MDEPLPTATLVERAPTVDEYLHLLRTRGLAGFYARQGYEAQRPDSPQMQRWVNGQAAHDRHAADGA